MNPGLRRCLGVIVLTAVTGCEKARQERVTVSTPTVRADAKIADLSGDWTSDAKGTAVGLFVDDIDGKCILSHDAEFVHYTIELADSSSRANQFAGQFILVTAKGDRPYGLTLQTTDGGDSIEVVNLARPDEAPVTLVRLIMPLVEEMPVIDQVPIDE